MAVINGTGANDTRTGTSGAAAATDIFIFEDNGSNGVLYYDADTAVAGYVVVATLDTGTLTNADILIGA
jgi:hypothetical protein